MPCPWGPCKLPRLQRSRGGWQRGVTALSVFYSHWWGGDKDLKASTVGKKIENEVRNVISLTHVCKLRVISVTMILWWYLTVGITSTDTHRNHEAPPYLMRVFSIITVMRGLCLWAAVFYSQNNVLSVYWSMFTVPSIGPRRRPSKCQVPTGSYPSCWGLPLLETARKRCRKWLFRRHPNFAQIVAICVKQNLNIVNLSVHQSGPSCAVCCVCVIDIHVLHKSHGASLWSW